MGSRVNAGGSFFVDPPSRLFNFNEASHIFIDISIAVIYYKSAKWYHFIIFQSERQNKDLYSQAEMPDGRGIFSPGEGNSTQAYRMYVKEN